MNPDSNKELREQLEVRIIAMLLGEASAFEKGELERLMTNDPELAAFHDQMKSTMGLTQEATKKATVNESATTQPKLSAERRKVLLAHFQQPKEKVLPLPEPLEKKAAEPQKLGKKNIGGRLLPWVGIAAAVTILSGLLWSPLSNRKRFQYQMPMGGASDLPSLASPDAEIAANDKQEQWKFEQRAKVASKRSAQDTTVYSTEVVGYGGTVSDAGAVVSSDVSSPAPTAPAPVFLPQSALENATDTDHDNFGDATTALTLSFDTSGDTSSLSTDNKALGSSGSPGGGRQHWYRLNTFNGPNDAFFASQAPSSEASTSRGAGNGNWGLREENLGLNFKGQTQFYDYDSENLVANNYGVPNEGTTTPNQNFRLFSELADSRHSKTDTFGMASSRGEKDQVAGWSKSASTNFIGDPEWIGILESPAQAHSITNRFVGRYAGVADDVNAAPALKPAAPSANPSGIFPALETAQPARRGAEAAARRPDLLNKKPESVEAAETLVQDGKLLMEMGKFNEAEAKLKEAVSQNSTPAAAKYYLDQIKEKRYLAEAGAKDALAGVESEKVWPTTQRQRSPSFSGIPAESKLGHQETRALLETKLQDAESLKKTGRGGDATEAKKQIERAQQVEPELVAQAKKDLAVKKPTPPAVPQPEILTRENAFSTFSLNVSDVSFKLAAASLQNNTIPDAGSIRVEEFINAFNYRDPAPAPGARLAFAWERARYPFAHNRDIVRLSVQTAARGRDAQKPLNLVILLDNSGSMERADRVAIVHEALKVLAQQLRPQDRISVIGFSRTARLWVDGMAGGDSKALLSKVLDLNPEGGTNLEEAMTLGYATAKKHFMLNGVNRVILFTDGAANLGNVEPEELKKSVVAERQKGIALDCFGIGWEGYNDDLLETLSRNGDGRYGFLNRPEQAAPEFANQLAGALNVAASDVKTQVEFNPKRVTSWRQIGYAKHQLTKEQFRDNKVDAAEIAAAEQGNALYVIETNPEGSGPIGVVRVRFKAPETGEYHEQEWPLEYQPRVSALDQSTPAMRLAVSASAFGEWLSTSPFAAEVTLPALQNLLQGVSENFSPDPRPQQLTEMIRQARTITGK